jgi:hypothetical protein
LGIRVLGIRYWVLGVYFLIPLKQNRHAIEPPKTECPECQKHKQNCAEPFHLHWKKLHIMENEPSEVKDLEEVRNFEIDGFDSQCK